MLPRISPQETRSLSRRWTSRTSHARNLSIIVNEILVAMELQRPNIANFLDSYLVRNNELWVVMEYMEGGALTIENNALEEDQISSVFV